MLGMPPLIKRHTGQDLADEVSSIIEYFEIADVVGYFTLDNATNNDTCIEALSKVYLFKPDERRIRCAPHTINLAVRSMMYGDGAKKTDFHELLGKFQADSGPSGEGEMQNLREAIQMIGDDEYWDEHQEEVLAAADEDDILAADAVSDFPAVSAEIPALVNASSLEQYRKSGPFGKLHNIGVCLRLSSQLTDRWMKCQQAVDPNHPPLAWRHNVATRWLSDEGMAARALTKRPALDRLLTEVGDTFARRSKKSRSDKPPEILQYKLTEDEWLVVDCLQQVLEQFKISAKILQGDGFSGLGKRSTTGSLWEYFPQIEVLLDHLEGAVRGFIIRPLEDGTLVKVRIFEGIDSQTRRLLKVYFRLGWKKLHDYYEKMTPIAYYTAVIFHPAKKVAFLDRLWRQIPCKQKDGWRDWVSKRLRELWEELYKNKEVNKPADRMEIDSLDYLERRLAFINSTTASDDEYSEEANEIPEVQRIPAQRNNGRSLTRSKPVSKSGSTAAKLDQDELDLYLSEPAVDQFQYRDDPLLWWREHGERRFPRLSHMAADLLSIPSSTAETERQFNSAGRMISSTRNHLGRALIGQAQSMGSWSTMGIYKPEFPIHLLQSQDWYDNLVAQGHATPLPNGVGAID
ncbi:uncharacterized protein JN550_002827 [Neoarthrinium moseri]|uniref:uncharacterized protein n=1 Tax=Neoarthrinium moseri TaxID=1658444 RepID=UPI001FDC2A15|nr:uncharacterized protein JN550_002827 [Neoarthrinium moseri]KAI1874248.1 hypothetical protein JN550_002827 [Neoarthrinium moseri]